MSHSRMPRMLLGAVLAMTVFATPALATEGDTDDAARIEEAAAAEAADVTSPADRLPMDATMRNAVVQALRSDLAAPGRTASERMRTQMELARLVGPASAMSMVSSASVNAVAAHLNSRSLNVTHFAQEKSYWCGPASARMMLNYLNYPTSRYDGVALSQTNLASSTYLGTTTSGTTWTSKGMSSGINKWMQGNSYTQVQSPSAATVRGAFTMTIDSARQPVAADTVEWQGGLHYNGHPDRTIGHWIVGYGYNNLGAQTKWMDPATSYYPNASATFQVETTDFLVFLQSNGIMY